MEKLARSAHLHCKHKQALCGFYVVRVETKSGCNLRYAFATLRRSGNEVRRQCTSNMKTNRAKIKIKDVSENIHTVFNSRLSAFFGKARKAFPIRFASTR